MQDREFLKDYKALILELNKLVPDVAELELKNNLDGSRRVIIGLTEFENKYLTPFKNRIKAVRTEILSKKK